METWLQAMSLSLQVLALCETAKVNLNIAKLKYVFFPR